MKGENVDINAISEIRSRTTVYFGVNAITKIAEITGTLKNMGISRVLVVTGKSSFSSSGAWAYVEKAFRDNGFTYELFNGITPNPEVDQVDEAVKIGKKINAQVVFGIGGGSPIDAAKSAAILLANPVKIARELYEAKFTAEKALPIVTINLTHGTGTEINRFAVVSIPEKQFKPVIAFDCIYPLFSIDDPALMTGLSADQTRYVSIDAINHVIEAATTTVASYYSVLLARETIRLVVKYLPIALDKPNNLTARYFLTYAAMLAGIAFDNSLLHSTHALEHPLSAMKPEVIHGQGLALLLPAVVREIYHTKGAVLADILSPIVPGLTGNESESDDASSGIRRWLTDIGVPSGLKAIGFSDTDVPVLTNLALTTPSLGFLLSLTPVKADESTIERMYRRSI